MSWHFQMVEIAAAAILLAAVCAEGATPAEHPSLLLTAKGVEILRKRIAEFPPARARFESLRQSVDKAMEHPVELPPRGANWYHWYVCPRHGNRLTTGKQTGPWTWEHICPVDREVLRGDPSRPSTDYDGCRLAGAHSALAEQIRDAGLLYQITGEARYAARAREVLLAYAERYARYPLHNINNEPKLGGGRVGSQTLDESVWLIPVCQGADMIWPTLTNEQRALIAEKLLLPAACEVIMPHKMGVHNIQCWKNSAVGLVGFLLRREDLIKHAIDDPASGYRRQLAGGVLAEGAWWEGAWGYHFYTLSALWPLAEAASNNGVDLYLPELKKMFDAPLKFVMPNMRLPNFSDTTEVDLPGRAPLYELAYARWKDAEYVPLLAASKRDDAMAMYFGVYPLPTAQPRARSSANYPGIGQAILTRAPKDAATDPQQATWLCMKYGPHGGGHGHPDKLSFILYAAGEVVSPDPGITSYGSPYHQNWYKTSLAHNTLVVDEENQRPATGKCLAFGSAEGIDYVMADAGEIYPGVRFVRSAALIDADTVVVIDQVRAKSKRTLDIAYHQRGQWVALQEGTQYTPPRKPGYQCMTDATVREVADNIILRTKLRDGRTASVILMGGQPTQVITGMGIGASTADRVPMVVFRRSSATTAFVWAVSLSGQTIALQGLKVRLPDGAAPDPAGCTGVEVTSAGRTIRLLANADRVPVEVILPNGHTWAATEAFSVK